MRWVFQVVASALLGGVLLLVLSQRRRAPRVAAATLLAGLGGLAMLWAPDATMVLANRLGIGRGTDLVLYCWALVSFALLVHLYLITRDQAEQITTLTRRLALLEARRPGDPPPPSAPGT